MAIENTVLSIFLSTFVDSIGVFDCCLPGVEISNLIRSVKKSNRKSEYDQEIPQSNTADQPMTQ